MSEAPSLQDDPAPPGAGDADAPAVGPNLRRVRTKRGLSLERLARRSGVSRSMLSQIELGQTAPTVTLLWKIARSLGVPFSALIGPTHGGAPQVLRARESKVLTNQEGSFSSRALFPPGDRPQSEFFEVRLKIGAQEQAQPRAPGTLANLVVGAGAVDVTVDRTNHHLDTADAMSFGCDVAHAFRNTGRVDALIYLVVTNPDPMD
ncbi:MAG TPA: helix-turn-helix domain-containing protein [Polyangia bacterium]|nr:helix-turn-helix domain-containing protein [Polyangia bacterium]